MPSLPKMIREALPEAMAEKDPFSGKMLDRKPVRRGSLSDMRINPHFAKIPPMAAGETELINENVPQPKKKDDHSHGDHAQAHKVHSL